ncbi:MAG: hypothetical protein ABIX10_00455 [Acidimicrobiales bacterium]
MIEEMLTADAEEPRRSLGDGHVRAFPGDHADRPTTVGQYLSAIALGHPDAAAALFPLLKAEPGARTVAVHAHLLRAAGEFEWGGAEGRLFELAHGETRPEIVRWWAADALILLVLGGPMCG